MAKKIYIGKFGKYINQYFTNLIINEQLLI